MKRFKYELKILNKPNGDYVFDDINKLYEFIKENNIKTDFNSETVFEVIEMDNYNGFILSYDLYNDYNLSEFNITDLDNLKVAEIDNYTVFEYNDNGKLRYFWCVNDPSAIQHKLKEASLLNENNKNRIKINCERYSMKKLFKGGKNE